MPLYLLLGIKIVIFCLFYGIETPMLSTVVLFLTPIVQIYRTFFPALGMHIQNYFTRNKVLHKPFLYFLIDIHNGFRSQKTQFLKEYPQIDLRAHILFHLRIKSPVFILLLASAVSI
jgi:hypothetical protein